jgi:transcriptional regulator with XRE-family HTH domain
MKRQKKFKPRATTAVDAYIGAQIRDRRSAAGLSQAALGDKVGVESGVNRVTAARLFEICEALDVSLASMFERKLKA